MKQVASVVSGVPNIMLAQNNIESILANDLRLTYSDGLDFIVTQRTRDRGHPDVGDRSAAERDPPVGVGAVGGRLQPGHADPDAGEQRDARHVDVRRNRWLAGAVCVRRRAVRAAERSSGCRSECRRTSRNPTVVDSQAFGKLYASPVSLASFEENAGKTNTRASSGSRATRRSGSSV